MLRFVTTSYRSLILRNFITIHLRFYENSITLMDLVMLALAALNPPGAAVDPAVDPP
jgi:hypothetical protein